ncbi:MAG: aminoacyl-tRNA hydrolase [Fimbriimonadaceae bacterium]|nr:aminoacyl-tRNA hydrolase [Fimbriimonadaceae bacterium]
MIVGLGNPGPEYSGTRHNVGFDVIELLAERYKIKLNQSKHRSRFGTGRIDGIPVVLVKPLTYMNLSGQAVAPMARQYGLKPDRILVVSDEMDLPMGRLRLRVKGSSGGHNGHKSISASLGSQEYPRLRLGIGRPKEEASSDHVLSKFHPEERPDWQEMIESAAAACEKVLEKGVEPAMQEVNRNDSGY